MTFIINNRQWNIKFVNASSGKLHRSDGYLTVGVTDGNDNCVYLSNLLVGLFLRKVVCHELCHTTFSFQSNRKNFLRTGLVFTAKI